MAEPTGQPFTSLGGEGRVEATGGEIDGEGWALATVPTFGLYQSAPVGESMLADRGLSTSATDGAVVGSAVACRGDGCCFALPHTLADTLASCSAQRAPEGTVHGGVAPEGSSSPSDCGLRIM